MGWRIEGPRNPEMIWDSFYLRIPAPYGLSFSILDISCSFVFVFLTRKPTITHRMSDVQTYLGNSRNASCIDAQGTVLVMSLMSSLPQ